MQSTNRNSEVHQRGLSAKAQTLGLQLTAESFSAPGSNLVSVSPRGVGQVN